MVRAAYLGAHGWPTPRRARSRGEIEQLRSGSLRVKVYAGIDPLTKKRHYLTETVPAGPTAAKDAERCARASSTRSTSSDSLFTLIVGPALQDIDLILLR